MNNEKFNEYYFDYQIDCIKNDLDINKDDTPRIIIERSYMDSNLMDHNYQMFIVIPNWYASRENFEPNKELRRSKITRVKITYDVNGINSDKIESNIEDDYDFSKYKKTFSINLNCKDNNFNGVGEIELFGKDSKSSKYIFAVNFIFRKKIAYSILKENDKLKFIFETNECFDCDIPLILLRDSDRMPCLKKDIQNEEKNKTLKFTKPLNFANKKIVEFTDADLKSTNMDNISFKRTINTIKDKCIVDFDKGSFDYRKYFLLDCVLNKTLDISNEVVDIDELEYVCPFCHEKMNINSDNFMKLYNEGAVSCRGENNNNYWFTKEGKSERLKKIIYCDNNDLGTTLILPDNFLKQRNYKIFINGIRRAGKSVFFSKSFGFSMNNGRITVTADILKNGLSKYFGKNLNVYTSPEIKKSASGVSYEVKNNEWYNSSAIGKSSKNNYPIVLDECFPETSELNDDPKLLSRPFILDINRQSKMFFYDISGEKVVTNGLYLGGNGMFIFINADYEEKEGNYKNLLKPIENVYKNKKVPAAFIVTKFDKYMKEFNENSQCLRTDVYNMSDKNYHESRLESNINIASEEIKSWLSTRDVGAIVKQLEQYFTKVSYFGVSALGQEEIVRNIKVQGKDKNWLLFDSSSIRAELPFLWMMYQLKIIK